LGTASEALVPTSASFMFLSGPSPGRRKQVAKRDRAGSNARATQVTSPGHPMFWHAYEQEEALQRQPRPVCLRQSSINTTEHGTWIPLPIEGHRQAF
jgi:hypothetical protein